MSRNNQTSYKVLKCATAGTTYVVGNETTIIRLLGPAAFNWRSGPAGGAAAASTDMGCAAGVPEYFGVDAGDTIYFSVAGVNICEMSN